MTKRTCGIYERREAYVENFGYSLDIDIRVNGAHKVLGSDWVGLDTFDPHNIHSWLMNHECGELSIW